MQLLPGIAILASLVALTPVGSASPSAASSGQAFVELVKTLRERRAQTRELVAAHAATLQYLPGRVLSAELDLACEALRRGHKNATTGLVRDRGLRSAGNAAPEPDRSTPAAADGAVRDRAERSRGFAGSGASGARSEGHANDTQVASACRDGSFTARGPARTR